MQIWLEEKIGNPDLFTGRKKELDYFLNWIERIKRKISNSHAVLSRRKTGKTALLQRLFNLTFEKNDIIIPFYFEIKESEQWLGDFAREFFLTFAYQYIAFKTRSKAYLIAGRTRTLEDALKICKKEGIEILENPISGMITLFREENSVAMWELAREAPRGAAELTDERVLQIIDEFQFLNRFIFWDKEKTRQADIAGTYLGTAEYMNAPLLVSGSWVGWLTRDLLKLLPGRFQFHYLETMPQDEALDMILKYSCLEDIPVSEETVPLIAGITEGNPFYISALFRSKYAKKDFTKETEVLKTLEYETLNKEGGIRGTWMEYAAYALQESNNLNAKKIVLYLSKHREREVSRKEIKEKLNLEMSDSELEKKLKILILADIIEQGTSNFYYQGVRDNIFDKVFRGKYADEIEDFDPQEITNEYKQLFRNLKKNYKNLCGEYSHFKGKFAEYLIIDNLRFRVCKNRKFFQSMMKNLPDDFEFSEYKSVWSYSAAPLHKRDIQLDIFARAGAGEYSLIGEVKNRKGRFSVREAEEFIQKAKELIELENLDKVLLFIFSTGGFFNNTCEYLKKQGIAWTDDRRWMER